MRLSIRKKSNLIDIIENWSILAGEQLSKNCIPIRLQKDVLFVGAEHPQWRQALIYNRMKLLASIKAAGHKVKDIKVQQYHPPKNQESEESELSVWERHPSRIDVHGIAICPCCDNPAPAGEMALWGNCGFCRRKNLS